MRLAQVLELAVAATGGARRTSTTRYQPEEVETVQLAEREPSQVPPRLTARVNQ